MLGLSSLKLALFAGVALAVIGAVGAMISTHDARIVSERVIREQAAALTAMTADHARQVAALEANAAAMADRLASSSQIKESIRVVTHTTACADSPAGRAAIAGLRGRAAPPAATPGGAGVPVRVPR
jgi:hypothetical protein